MPADRSPKSDEKTLYIPSAYSSETLENLTERAMDHFNMTAGEATRLLAIDIESIQVYGCMCHPSPGDYETYFVITRTA